MFVLLKLLKPFFLPPTLIAIGMLASLIFFFRKRYRLGMLVLAPTLVIYYMISLEPVSILLARSLEEESSFSVVTSIPSDTEAIVVLAGGVEKANDKRPFPELGGASWRRLWRGVSIYYEQKEILPIVYSGDSGDPFVSYAGEAVLAKQYALRMGIPEAQFWIEEASRTTAESGKAVRQLLDERFPGRKRHRVVLVTSEQHMPRASVVMEAVGIDPLPFPADFMGRDLVFTPLSFFPSAGAFAASATSIHEWVGRAAYWVFGWTRE